MSAPDPCLPVSGHSAFDNIADVPTAPIGSETQMEELVKSARFITGEGFASYEPALAVERECGFEGGAASGLQAESGQAAGPSLGDDALQQQRGSAAAYMLGVGAHRFHLARTVAQQLQGADRHDRITVPGAPDAHVRPGQPRQVEREHAPGR